jgi:RNA-binding protein
MVLTYLGLTLFLKAPKYPPCLFKKLSALKRLTEEAVMGFCRKIYKAYYVDVHVFREGDVLQRLGKVLSVTPSQNMVVKIDKATKLGASVIDENLKVIGRIFDIIGPVSSPYAVIKPSVKTPEMLVNKQLYVSPSRRERS